MKVSPLKKEKKKQIYSAFRVPLYNNLVRNHFYTKKKTKEGTSQAFKTPFYSTYNNKRISKPKKKEKKGGGVSTP